ncbi:MAG TPA: replicative DNA helicase [Azospirillaceae bacterium]|nr:replicative DNA helicase [Azospirillaceae bacterium]
MTNTATLLRTVPPAGATAGAAPGTPGYRSAPRNEEAERSVLGAILVNNAALNRVVEFLEPEHFCSPVHARIYAAIRKLVLDRNQEASPITLKAYFQDDPDLAGTNGAQYLAELAEHVVSVVNVEDYGRVVYDAYLRRQLIEIGEDMVNDAYRHDLDAPPQEQLETAEKRLFDLATTGSANNGFTALSISVQAAIQTAQEAFKRSSHVTGVTCGLTDIDRKMGGLHPSDLIILAGRPSMGKTSLATNMAFNAAKAYLESNGEEGAVVGFFSLEMSSEQLANRLLADVSEVPSDKIRRGDIKDTDFQRFVEAAALLNRLPFFIDDTPGISVTGLRTRARRLHRTHKLGLIVVDYLQLLSGSSRGGENRVQEISEITRGLKAVAKELDVPVIALSQLSRAVEQREDKRPQLSDLRESGSIEQDADVVMFVFREQYYLERAEPSRRPDETDDKFNDRYQRWQQRLGEVHNTAEVILAKQRHGPIGTVRLHFEGQFTRFSDLDPHHPGGDYSSE